MRTTTGPAGPSSLHRNRALPMLAALAALTGAVGGCSGQGQSSVPIGMSTSPRSAVSVVSSPTAPVTTSNPDDGSTAARTIAIPTHRGGVQPFLSPSGNISCQFDDATKADGDVYCQTGEPPQSVTMRASGTWSDCHGPDCIGNPGESTVTLPYGRSVSAGPFTCASTTDGITCTTDGARGFRIASQGIVAVSAQPPAR